MRLRTRVIPFVLSMLPLAANAQFPVLRSWPDASFPCNGTLQACIDGSDPDDGIEIATNGPIDESIIIDKTLSFAAASGFQPVFAAGRSILGTSPGGGDRFFLIEGLTLTDGTIFVRNLSAGWLSARVRNNRCNAIRFQADTGGPAYFEITDNVLTPAFGQPEAILAWVEDAFASAGAGRSRILRNTIVMPPTNDAHAIDVEATVGALEVDIAGNRVTGAFYARGISLAKGVSASLDARVVNNLVTGASVTGGYGIVASGQSGDGVTDVTIVNNTVTESYNGILTNAFDTVVANNAVTGSPSIGYTIGPTGGATVVQRNHLAFDNGTDFFSTPAGPNSVFEDPLYGDTTDFRPTPYSPVVNAADDSLLPAEFTTDLDGNPRRRGALDIGAYEVPEASGALATLAALLALRMRLGLTRPPRAAPAPGA